MNKKTNRILNMALCTAIWLVSVLGVVATIKSESGDGIIPAALWLIFVTSALITGIIEITSIRRRIENKTRELEKMVISEDEYLKELKWDISNKKREIEDIKEIIRDLKGHWNYQEYKKVSDGYYKSIEEQEALESEVEELKKVKMEIVESLTNLDGFKGIKALVSNMVKLNNE